MSLVEDTVSGVTTCEGWEEKFRFAISDNDEDKLNILLQSTGYLTMDQFDTTENSIANGEMINYSEHFIPNDGPRDGEYVRHLLALENGALQLDLSIKFTVPGGSWTVNYKFQLEPFSLERVRALEAKVRDLEEELAAQNARDPGLVR
ncbi:hypothetical protein V7S43_004974 [Phytophthora oleae]|uniref:Uncharacterized protein n=1 Tax=Phytophthora oleae TaxID=2107226 RepID=A0ABD3FX96_9STRA